MAARDVRNHLRDSGGDVREETMSIRTCESGHSAVVVWEFGGRSDADCPLCTANEQIEDLERQVSSKEDEIIALDFALRERE